MLEQFLDPSTPLFWVIIGIITAIITMIIWKRFKFIVILMKFSYPNAKFNAMGNKYVLRPELERLIVTRNLTDATNLIISRDYQFKELRSIDELEHALDKTNLDFFELIFKDAPKVIKPLITAYLKKYEVSMLKTVLRAKLHHKPKEDLENALLPIGQFTPTLIMKCIEAERAEEVVEFFNNEPYYEELKDLIQEYHQNFHDIETLLDRYIFTELQTVDKSVDASLKEGVHKFVYELFDIANVKILLRTKHAHYTPEQMCELLMPAGLRINDWKLEQMCECANVSEIIIELEGTPYFAPLRDVVSTFERTGSVSAFEIALDRYLLQSVIKQSTAYFTTIGPLLRFMVSKEFEIRNLRTVLHGLYEGWSDKQLLPLLVYETSEA